MLEVFISDVHLPYEDRAAYGLTLEVIKSLKPDLIFLGGDILDFYSVSRYDKDANRKLTLQSDLNYAYEELSYLRKIAPKAEIALLSGNHENRLDIYLNSKAEALSTLDALTIPNLLKLDTLKIKWIPNGTRMKIGKLWHLHGNEIPGAGVNVAKAKFDRLGSNVIFGHHHKLQSYIHRNYDGDIRGAWANGCLSDLQAEYAHFTDWIQGFSLIEYGATGNFHVEQVAIVKPSVNSLRASCFVRGREYQFQADKENRNKLAPYAKKQAVLYKGLIMMDDK